MTVSSRVLDIAPELAEMALDELPGAARGDAHRLVVVAGRAARGKGVAEPEPVFLRDRVGEVGEGRGALVGGDHQIGIVAVVPDDLRRRHDAMRRPGSVRDDVVGQVEQAADQRLVAFDPLGRQLFARVGRLLHDKAALRPDRHDDRVLDRLRLHQPEDLGAEILLAVGPADAAARDLAGAHVHPLDPRAVDVDLEKRPRQRQQIDLAAGELDGQIGLSPRRTADFW